MKAMESDERYHPLVEGTSAAIFVFDAERILYINPASKHLTGRSARELLDRPFPTLLHADFRPALEQSSSVAGPRHLMVQLLRKGREARWVDLHVQPVLFRGMTATMATAFDIHELKESDLARRQAEVQLKLVQRAGRTVSWDWRVATDELVVYGLPKDLLKHGPPSLATTGQAFFTLLDAEDHLPLKQSLRRALHDREPLFVEIDLTDPKGEDHWLVLRGQAVLDRSGRAEHIVGVATDVTERRRAEQALVAEQEHTLAMLTSLSDGVIRTDLEGKVLDLSAPAERLLGGKLDDFLGRRLDEVVTLYDQETGDLVVDPVKSVLARTELAGQPQNCRLQRGNGDDLPVRLHVSILRDHSAAAVGVILVLKDLVQQRRVQRGLVYLATHDSLTDLVNRSEFERQVVQAVTSTRKQQRQDSLLYMDIDGFRLINDTFGHPAGDRLLKQFASFLKCRFRETDTLCRLGEDKFGVLLESCTPWQARELVEKLYKDLRSYRFDWEEASLPINLSTGLAAIGPDTDTVEEVLCAAEAACYLAKQKGGNRFQEYEPDKLAATERHTQLEILHQIQDALREGSFELYAQLIQPVQAPDSNPFMYEILVRMIDRGGRLMRPTRFIPVAERHRIVSAIDRWVLTRTLEAVADYRRARQDDSTVFTINISAQSLSDDRFLEFVLHELSYRGIQGGRICFEITETATVTSFEKAQRFISVVRGRGCGFVLDDFGTGLSSFAYLRNFPVDYIKIDGQFVLGLAKDPTQRALVESINHVGHVMHIKTIAESVEDDEALAAVREMRVDYAQGHGISRPAPLARLLEITPDQALSSTI